MLERIEFQNVGAAMLKPQKAKVVRTRGFYCNCDRWSVAGSPEQQSWSMYIM